MKCGGIYSEIQKLDEHHDKRKVVSNGTILLIQVSSSASTCLFIWLIFGSSLFFCFYLCVKSWDLVYRFILNLVSWLDMDIYYIWFQSYHKLTITNQSGSIRLLDKESLKNTIPEKKGKSVPSNEKFIPCSAKANSSATLPCLTYQRNLKETSGSNLGSSRINIKTNVQGDNVILLYLFVYRGQTIKCGLNVAKYW